MKCPFCEENLIEGYLFCPECGNRVMDFDYFENMEKMEKKYSKTSLLELSREKLTFDEIITIYTYIERADHHFGDSEFSEGCGENGTSSNLRKRLDEMKMNITDKEKKRISDYEKSRRLRWSRKKLKNDK